MRSEVRGVVLLAATTVAVASGCNVDTNDLLHVRAGASGSEIWVMDEGGQNGKLVTNGELPQWIWAGRSHFAYFVGGPPCDPGFPKVCGTLYVAQWDASTRAITGSPIAITGPTAGETFSWSRDGQWIAYESFQNNNWEIYKVRRDGTQPVNLSKSPSSRDLEPDWGRNGAQNGMIAFASDGTGDRDILIMDEDGNGKKNLTSHLTDGGDDWSPVWSADQSGIAFVGTHQAWGNFTPNIYVTWLATPNSLGVVSDHTAGSHSLPAWEGNTSVFYVGQYTPSPAIFRYDVAATQRTRLTSLPGVTGEQYAVNPQFIYIGTNNGIKSVEWHYQNRVADIGSGWNPDLP